MPELEPPLLRARILADHELPREHICLECRTQSFGCLLSIGLMLRSTTVRAAVSAPGKTRRAFAPIW